MNINPTSDGPKVISWFLMKLLFQSDEARPELPLTDKKVENYPVGLCIDTSSIHQLPWGK